MLVFRSAFSADIEAFIPEGDVTLIYKNVDYTKLPIYGIEKKAENYNFVKGRIEKFVEGEYDYQTTKYKFIADKKNVKLASEYLFVGKISEKEKISLYQWSNNCKNPISIKKSLQQPMKSEASSNKEDIFYTKNLKKIDLLNSLFKNYVCGFKTNDDFYKTVKMEFSNNPMPDNVQVTLRSIKSGKTIVITKFHNLMFLGDLNNDGIPDYIVNLVTHDCEANSTFLNLSTKKKSSDIIYKIIELSSGCC